MQSVLLDYLLLYPWNVCFYGFSVIIYIIGYSHLAYCFNHNLFHLVISQRSSVIQTDTNKASTDMNIQQKKIF